MKKITILLLSCYAFLFCLIGYKLYLRLTHPIKYQNEISFACQENNLSESLIASIVNTESSYNSNARSSKNALGLMQIKLSTANYMCKLYSLEKLTELDLLNPQTNLNFGCLYLTYLKNKFSDTWTALAAYNAGETRVRVWLKNSQYSSDGKTLELIPFKETKNYIEKIKNNVNFYKKIYKN